MSGLSGGEKMKRSGHTIVTILLPFCLICAVGQALLKYPTEPNQDLAHGESIGVSATCFFFYSSKQQLSLSFRVGECDVGDGRGKAALEGAKANLSRATCRREFPSEYRIQAHPCTLNHFELAHRMSYLLTGRDV